MPPVLNTSSSRLARSARVRGRGTKVLSAVVGLAAFSLVSDVEISRFVRLPIGVVLSLIAGIVWDRGLSLDRRARRLLVDTSIAFVAADARPPVVYLRSFRDDAAASGLVYGTSEAGLHELSRHTKEEQLASVFAEIGPFVAIGKPNEELPELGARREYVSDDSWQLRVTALISSAKLVILRAAASNGLIWEVAEEIRRGKPERLLVLVPSKREYAQFRSRCADLFPRGLPEYPRWHGARADIYGILRFKSDWTVTALRLRLPFRFSASRTPLAAALKATLAPVFDELGLRYEPLKLGWAEKLWLGCGGTLAALVVVVLALIAATYLFR